MHCATGAKTLRPPARAASSAKQKCPTSLRAHHHAYSGQPQAPPTWPRNSTTDAGPLTVNVAGMFERRATGRQQRLRIEVYHLSPNTFSSPRQISSVISFSALEQKRARFSSFVSPLSVHL